MSGVTRRLLGGVLAISLFMCSSLSVFAADPLYFHDIFFPYFGSALLRDSNSNDIDEMTIYDESYDDDIMAPLFNGIGHYSYYPSSPFSLGTTAAGESHLYLLTSVKDYTDSSVSLFLKAASPASGSYVSTFSFLSDTDFSKVTPPTVRIRVYDYRTDNTTSGRILVDIYPEVAISSSPSSSGRFYNTINLYYDLPEFISYISSSIERLDFNFHFLRMPVGALYYDFNYSSLSTVVSDNTSLVSDKSFFGTILTSGFDRVSSLLRTLLYRENSAEDNYAAVTDPATSQEIQDTQDMIDNVENFEASLNHNITTEFNKIDFTTPTNLAAPVSFVADKVTRSINSLGSGYQPLVFVPLTLGIMLIFLGRGVTALGQMRPSSRFDPLDHIRDNSHDERWLW